MKKTQYQVQWLNSLTNELHTHGTYDTIDLAIQSIYDWWKENDYTPKYMRVIDHGDHLMIDYGLHYCFYSIVKTTDCTNTRRN